MGDESIFHHAIELYQSQRLVAYIFGDCAGVGGVIVSSNAESDIRKLNQIIFIDVYGMRDTLAIHVRTIGTSSISQHQLAIVHFKVGVVTRNCLELICIEQQACARPRTSWMQHGHRMS